MKKILLIILYVQLIAGCNKDYEAPVPDYSGWDEYNNATTDTNLNSNTRNAMEGVYTLNKAAGDFGELTAIKWSYTHNGNDTSFHVSGFFGKDISYFICEGKKSNGSILLNGYWRKMESTATGIMHLVISPSNGATLLLSPNPVVTPGAVTMEGYYGNGNNEPTTEIRFVYTRPLNKTNPDFFQIMAHRSGGRTSDLLPVSENSVEMILKTSEFGSTGIEIDVRLTSDGIPILYHDNTLNLRLIQKSGLTGAIENYSYAQLSDFVRLIHGEKIPTLRQALDAVVYRTGLSYVWLDTKYAGPLNRLQAIQKEYIAKAAAAGRNVHILIGLPGEDQLNEFLKLPDYSNTPSLCELTIDDVKKCNSKVWAPRFTEGTQIDKVEEVHSLGKLAFVWTLDVPEFISDYINNGMFDAILSNFPSCVAYYYYVRQ
jgi:glycerophosphoryl diester phosphodiesterase